MSISVSVVVANVTFQKKQTLVYYLLYKHFNVVIAYVSHALCKGWVIKSVIIIKGLCGNQ